MAIDIDPHVAEEKFPSHWSLGMVAGGKKWVSQLHQIA